MIKNIVFDMGNVVIRFDPNLFMEREGVAEEDRQLLMREVYCSPEWSMMDRGSLTDEQAAEIMNARVPERLREVVPKLVAFYHRPILEIEGIYELIKELKDLGYPVYLLSNASCRQHDYWPKVPASKLFDGTLISCDVKLVKPMPEIYLRLYQTFGLKADECFFIDDNPVNVEAAMYTGMHGAVFFQDIVRLRRNLRAAGVPVKQL